MDKIVKNYIYNGLYQLFVIVVPLVTAPYLARVLGATNLGIYSYVNSSANLIVNLGLLGIYDYGVRQIAYCRDSKKNVSQTFWELVILRLALTVVVTVIYFAVMILSVNKYYFLLYFPWIFANCLDCSWLFVGMEDMGATCLKNFFAKLASVICIFLFVKKENDLWIYVLSLALSVLFANFVVYFQLRKYVTKPHVKFTNLLIHIRGSLRFFFPQIAMLAYTQIDKVMIGNIVGNTSSVAFYDQAEKIIQIPLSLITVASTVMMPRIANEYKNGNQNGVKDFLILSGNFMLLAAIPLAVGLSCIAPQFIPWYLGEGFTPSIIAMIGLSPIVIANALSGLAGKQYLTAVNQMDILFKSYLITAVINIALNGIMIPVVGWMGAIIATDISAITCAIIQIKHVYRQIPQIKSIWASALNAIACSIIMAVVVVLLGEILGIRIITTCVQILSGVIIYIIGLYISKNSTLLLALNGIRSILRRRRK